MNIQITIFFSFFFLVSELLLMLLKRSHKSETKSQNDKKSLRIFWIVIPFSITIGFFLADYQNWHNLQQTLAGIGLVIGLSGLVIRWLSILQLKKDFTVDVAINSTHQLQTNLMYRYIRHPSYLGLLLIGLGLGIAMNSLWSFLIVFVSFYVAILYRIKVEESILIEEFGKSYIDYIDKTKRLLFF